MPVMSLFRRLNKLKEDHGQSGDLTDYFNIKTNNINNKLKLMVIIPTMNEGIINIKIRYSIPQLLIEFQNLPLELNELIHSLIDYQLIVQVQMSLPKEYPFRPAYFRLVGMKNTIEPCKTKGIYKFFKNKIKIYNEVTHRNWSPAMGIEKTIIDFFSLINHFDSFFEIL